MVDLPRFATPQSRTILEEAKFLQKKRRFLKEYKQVRQLMLNRDLEAAEHIFQSGDGNSLAA